MSFEHMPEMYSKFGYFILLGVMTPMAAASLIFFRKKDGYEQSWGQIESTFATELDHLAVNVGKVS